MKTPLLLLSLSLASFAQFTGVSPINVSPSGVVSLLQTIPSLQNPGAFIFRDYGNVAGHVQLNAIPAPSSAPTLTNSASGGLVGVYSYAFTCGSLNGGESRSSPGQSITTASNTVTVAAALCPAPSTNRYLYRTASGGSTYQLVAAIDNISASVTDNAPDSTLGRLLGSYDTTGNALCYNAGSSCFRYSLDPFGNDAFFLGRYADPSGAASTLYLSKLYIPVPPPTGLTATPYSTGGTMTTGTYYYRVGSADGVGGWTGSTEVTCTIPASVTTGSCQLAWTAAPGASFYQPYRGSVSGGQNLHQLYVGGSPTTDNGSALTISGGVPLLPARWAIVSPIGTSIPASGITGTIAPAQLPTYLPPYDLRGSCYAIPMDGGYCAALPSFTGWAALSGTVATAGQPNGNYTVRNDTTTAAFWQQTAAVTSSIEAVFVAKQTPAGSSLTNQPNFGIYACDSTNHILYELYVGATSTYGSFLDLSSSTVTSCTAANTPSSPSGVLAGYSFAVPVVHVKLSWSGGNLTASQSLDGGASFQTISTPISVGTIGSSGIYDVYALGNIFSLKVQ